MQFVPHFHLLSLINVGLIHRASHQARGYRPEDLAALTQVQFVNKRVQFGLFASAAIARDTVLGEYVGELRELDLWQYAWAYPAELKQQGNEVEGNEINLVIDATRAGNQLRFVNDGGASSNCRVVYLSVNNTWRVFYQTKRRVAAGEELRVHYAQTSWGRISLRDTIAETRQHAAEMKKQRKRAASSAQSESAASEDRHGEGDGDDSGNSGSGDKTAHPTGGDYTLVAKRLAARTAEFAALTLRGGAMDALADLAVDTNEFPSFVGEGDNDDDALSIVDSDAWVAVMLQRGATNQTYVGAHYSTRIFLCFQFQYHFILSFRQTHSTWF